MKRTQMLPVVLIVIQVVAGLVYAKNHDVRRAVYWLAASVLTAAVTF